MPSELNSQFDRKKVAAPFKYKSTTMYVVFYTCFHNCLWSIHSSTLYMSYVEKSLLPCKTSNPYGIINILYIYILRWDQAKIKNDLCSYGKLSGLKNTPIPFTSLGGSKPSKYIWLLYVWLAQATQKPFPEVSNQNSARIYGEVRNPPAIHLFSSLC